MWIKHNKALYNSNDIASFRPYRTTLKAKFLDGTEEVLGSFNTAQEAEDIFRTITKALLFEDPDRPGIIIRDTKKKKEKKNVD